MPVGLFTVGFMFGLVLFGGFAVLVLFSVSLVF